MSHTEPQNKRCSRFLRRRTYRPHFEILEARIVFDTSPLAILDPNLQVAPIIQTGISQPLGMAFVDNNLNDVLVIEKASGQIKRFVNGVAQATPALDLAVNSNSERGLLSITLHPNFATNRFAYLYWTQSSTGADSTVVGEVPLLGNRVDRYVWNPTNGTFSFDRNIVALRSLQTDNTPVPGHEGTQNANQNGNHNGGLIKFGPDGKVYIFIGDLGRRGWMQNLSNGPFTFAPFVDDTFGGPQADDAHLTGVILRLNDDGTTPTDNPFFAAGAAIGGEVGANVQTIFSYGHRNGFGMSFDPVSGFLWETENADDAYSELNRVTPGMNGGWIQFAGPVSRIRDFKLIETTQYGLALQQVRYPPTRVAYSPSVALSKLHMLPGATYVDPEFSWRYEIGPSGTAFVNGNVLGTQYNGTLWMGSARANSQVGANGGSLYRFRLTADRLHVDTSADPRLADRVADNLFRTQKFEGTESETLLIGTGFGITPAIEQGPDGNLYVVSFTDNVIYRISRRPGAAPLPVESIGPVAGENDPNDNASSEPLNSESTNLLQSPLSFGGSKNLDLTRSRTAVPAKKLGTGYASSSQPSKELAINLNPSTVDGWMTNFSEKN